MKITPHNARVLRAEKTAREARKITRELEALADLTAQLGARRQELIRELAADHRWSQREIAAVVGISQPRVKAVIDGSGGGHG